MRKAHQATTPILVTDSQDLQDLISEAVRKAVAEAVPPAVERATQKRWLSTQEAVEYLGCSKRQLLYWKSQGKVAYSQHGRKVFFDCHSLDDFLAQGYVPRRKR